MARGGPDRGRPHAEIAVAEHRDGVAALLVEPDRGADRKPPPGAEPAAAVLAQIGHAALDRPDVERPAAAERAEAHSVGIVEARPQARGDLLHGDHAAIAALRLAGLARLPGRLGGALPQR